MELKHHESQTLVVLGKGYREIGPNVTILPLMVCGNLLAYIFLSLFTNLVVAKSRIGHTICGRIIKTMWSNK